MLLKVFLSNRGLLRKRIALTTSILLYTYTTVSTLSNRKEFLSNPQFLSGFRQHSPKNQERRMNDELGKCLTRGAFIVFEGVDRCGKTTQANLLADFLKANDSGKAEFIRFPDRTTPIGTMINSYLTNTSEMEDHSIHLLFSANRWEAVPSMMSKLQSGVTLVCDRYCYSGVAFSAAKDGLTFDWCISPDVGLPAPDCIIYLDLPIEKARERGDFGEERYEKEEMQVKVRENFFKLREMDQGNTPWYIIDASQTIEDISKQIQDITSKIIAAAAEKPVGQVWMRRNADDGDNKQADGCDDCLTSNTEESPQSKRTRTEK